MSKEKYLSESTIKETPKQRFSIKLKDSSVTSDKIADEAIITEKIADDSVTTPKIADKAITKDKLSQDVQDIVDDVGGKFDKSSIVQTIGTSQEKVMSQKAVTDELGNLHDIADNIVSVLVKNGFNIDLASSSGWTFSYRSITQSGIDGTFLPFTTLSVDAKWYAQDVANKVYNVTWTRDSGNQEADEAWNKVHVNNKLELPITYDDLGGNAYVMGKVNFTCTAEYDADGEWQKTQKTVCF